MLNEWEQKILKKLWKPFHPWLEKGIDQKRFGLTGEPKLLERSKSFVMLRGYKFTLQFEIVAIATRKPPTYTIKDEQGEIIQAEFYQKELIRAN